MCSTSVIEVPVRYPGSEHKTFAQLSGGSFDLEEGRHAKLRVQLFGSSRVLRDLGEAVGGEADLGEPKPQLL